MVWHLETASPGAYRARKSSAHKAPLSLALRTGIAGLVDVALHAQTNTHFLRAHVRLVVRRVSVCADGKPVAEAPPRVSLASPCVHAA